MIYSLRAGVEPNEKPPVFAEGFARSICESWAGGHHSDNANRLQDHPVARKVFSWYHRNSDADGDLYHAEVFMRFFIMTCFFLTLTACGGGGGSSSNSTTNPPPVVNPPATTYSFTVQVSGTGTVTPTIARRYAAGEVITLTATPGAGYIFAGWEGTDQGSNISPTNTVTMPAVDKVVFAFFQFTANG